MSVPIYNDKHVSQGLARLTSGFITKYNVRAWLAAILQQQQDLEDAAFQVLTMRFLRTAICYTLPETNTVFDVLAKLVGAPPRGGLSDVQLKTLIILQVAVNRATGKTTDWSRFAAILLPDVDALMYLDGDNADFYFGLWNLQLDPALVAESLTKGVPNGVYGELAYSVWPDGGDFEFTSVYDLTVGEEGWSSRYLPTVGGYLVAGIAMVPEPNGGSILGYTP